MHRRERRDFSDLSDSEIDNLDGIIRTDDGGLRFTMYVVDNTGRDEGREE